MPSSLRKSFVLSMSKDGRFNDADTKIPAPQTNGTAAVRARRVPVIPGGLKGINRF